MSEIICQATRSHEISVDKEKSVITNLRISKGYSSVFHVKKVDDCVCVTDCVCDDYSQLKEEGEKKGLTTYEATLALISSIMGCTLVSVPYSMTITGYLNGIIINVLVLALLMFATHLYLQAMEIFKIR